MLKFCVEQRELLDGLEAVGHVVPRKHSLPVLRHVLIENREDGVFVSGTNLESHIELQVQGAVVEFGSVLVLHSRLLRLVSSLGDGAVSLTELEGSRLRVEQDGAVFELECLDLGEADNEFPPMPFDYSGVKPVEVASASLLNGIAMTRFAVCRDEVRYNLTGARFRYEGGSLQVAATDGRMMSVCVSENAAPFEFSESVIIPRRGLKALEGLLPELGSVSLRFSASNGALFEFGCVRLSVRVIDGKFPNPAAVIPKGVLREVELDREAFLGVLERGASVTNDTFHMVKMTLESGAIEFEVVTRDVGVFKESLPVVESDDSGGLSPLVIAFSTRLLLKIVGRMVSESVVVRLKDNHSPCVFCEVGDDAWWMLLMPIRIDPD